MGLLCVPATRANLTVQHTASRTVASWSFLKREKPESAGKAMCVQLKRPVSRDELQLCKLALRVSACLKLRC
jgi:hypothetical protein